MQRRHAASWIGAFTVVLYTVPTFLILAEIASFGYGHPIVTPMVEALVGPICHHLPSRTVTLHEPLPVCARCTGLYTGWILTLPLATAVLRQRSFNGIGGQSLLVSAVSLLGLFGVAVLEATLEAAGMLSTPNATRLFYGLPLGFTPATILILGAKLLLRRSS